MSFKRIGLVQSPFISAMIAQVMATQFPLNVSIEAKNNIAYLRVTGAIYEWNNSATEITKQIDGFLAEGIQDIDVYLNGPGGDTFQAAEIENQIQRFPGSKTGTGGALIASAYTKIAASLDTFEQAENGQYMWHKPSGYFSGNEDTVESNLVLLKNITTQYKETYSAKTGMTVEEIEAAWKGGDVWLTAKEAAKKGFISGVIKKASIDKETKAMFEAVAAPTIPKITNTKNHENSKIMNKERLCALLGLSPDASEAQIEAAITANKEAATKVTALVKEKETAEATALEEKITAMLTKAQVVDKKITAKQVDGLRAWAKTNFEACEAHINELQPLEKISAAIVPTSGGAPAKAFADMTEKERDDLLEADPEAFKAAYTAHLEK